MATSGNLHSRCACSPAQLGTVLAERESAPPQARCLIALVLALLTLAGPVVFLLGVEPKRRRGWANYRLGNERAMGPTICAGLGVAGTALLAAVIAGVIDDPNNTGRSTPANSVWLCEGLAAAVLAAGVLLALGALRWLPLPK